MKKLLLFVILVFSGFTTTAQEYHPLIEDDKVWLEAFYIGANECAYEEVYQLRFGGDTLIAGNTYRKILKRSFDQVNPGPYCPPFEAQDGEFMVEDVFMREDTAAQQVLIWHVDNNNYPEGQEILLYDFNLEIGDTVPPGDIAPSDYSIGNGVIVDTVMNYTLLNGEDRQQFAFFTIDQGSYTEGIGGMYGLYRPHYPALSGWGSIMCIKQNGNFIYSQPGSLTQCNWMTAVDDIPVSSISLYPNPNNGLFKIDIDVPSASGTMGLMIFNAMGQSVYADRVVAGMNTIEASLQRGLYHWQLYSEDKPVQAGKIVVE